MTGHSMFVVSFYGEMLGKTIGTTLFYTATFNNHYLTECIDSVAREYSK